MVVVSRSSRAGPVWLPVPVPQGKQVSAAGLIAFHLQRPNQVRYIYRALAYRRRKGFAALVDGAHQQLGGNIVLVWDNPNTHVSAAIDKLIDK
ncbi:hypothetical protein [Catenulispora pinisilvae]|uniref:hypothetical protein n=1 Tax=Catenulispora pinisilvae TaxID=2705253 RepID=UPI001E400B90|nr:hypothetical protein [Catenulispora pinisilvae]